MISRNKSISSGGLTTHFVSHLRSPQSNDGRPLQDRSNIPDSNAKPVKSALKGGRAKHLNQNNNTSSNKESVSDESEESESESEEESENRPAPTPTPVLPAPLRPSALTRPSTTASNEKVSTQRNPLIGLGPMRPSTLLNKDNDKRDESKEDSITARLNSRIKQREEDNKKETERVGREPIRFSIPRPSSKSDGGDVSVSFNAPPPLRPSSKSEDNKKDEPKSKFNIPRPNSSSSRNEDKKEDAKTEVKNSPLRPTRVEEREDENKRHSSKADEIRAKFNIPRPGDSVASSALSRFRERRNEELEDSAKSDKSDEGARKTVGTKVEEVRLLEHFEHFVSNGSVLFG